MKVYCVKRSKRKGDKRQEVFINDWINQWDKRMYICSWFIIFCSSSFVRLHHLFMAQPFRKSLQRTRKDNCVRVRCRLVVKLSRSSCVVDIASGQILQLPFNSSLFGKVQKVAIVKYYCPFLPSSTPSRTKKSHFLEVIIGVRTSYQHIYYNHKKCKRERRLVLLTVNFLCKK